MTKNRSFEGLIFIVILALAQHSHMQPIEHQRALRAYGLLVAQLFLPIL